MNPAQMRRQGHHNQADLLQQQNAQLVANPQSSQKTELTRHPAKEPVALTSTEYEIRRD